MAEHPNVARLRRGFEMWGELPEGCSYTRWRRLRDEWQLSFRIWRSSRSEPQLERETISRLGSHVSLHVLRSRQEVREFLDRLDTDHAGAPAPQ